MDDARGHFRHAPWLVDFSGQWCIMGVLFFRCRALRRFLKKNLTKQNGLIGVRARPRCTCTPVLNEGSFGFWVWTRTMTVTAGRD